MTDCFGLFNFARVWIYSILVSLFISYTCLLKATLFQKNVYHGFKQQQVLVEEVKVDPEQAKLLKESCARQ